jgi:signal transduction histidine kinase
VRHRGEELALGAIRLVGAGACLLGVPARRLLGLVELGAIFEPFVQVGRSLTSMREGAGLGLAISRELARAMGGDVTVTSTLGAGSTFMLELPRSGPEAGARRPRVA